MLDFKVLECLKRLATVVPNMYCENDGTWVFIDGYVMCTIIFSPGLITIINTIPNKVVSYSTADHLLAIGNAIEMVYKQTNDQNLRMLYRNIYMDLQQLGLNRIIQYEAFIEEHNIGIVT
jgi:hypothetical protein